MALFYTIGTISDMSEVRSGEGQSGFKWQRMTIILDIPEGKGFVKKQAFQVSGDTVDEVLKFSIGQKVKVGWTIYAREWNEKWYNNVDLINITLESPAPQAITHQIFTQENLNPQTHEDLPF